MDSTGQLPTATHPQPSSGMAAQRWFVRLFALAVVAHVVGNPPLEFDLLGLVALVMGVAAAVLATAPDNRWLLVGTAALVPLTAWLEAPQLGNHWLVMSVVAIAVIAAGVRAHWWPAFAPTGRWILLVFYAFAAFSKLNSAFFDTSTSCGLFYANQSLHSWNLPTISGGVSATAIVVASAVIELSIPILLIIPRTRAWGVALGYLFHFVISADLDQHFYDFTAVLFALFILFVPTTAATLELRLEPWMNRTRRWLVVAAGAVFIVAAVLPLTRFSLTLLTNAFFWVWLPAGLALVVGTLRALPRRADATLRLPNWVAVAIVAIVVINGLTPYLELKTGFGFNMYSNLTTADGQTNHFLVPATLPLTAGNTDLMIIVDTDDPGLAAYVGSGYAIPRPRLADYLADRPDATLSVTPVGSDRVVRTSGAELGESLPLVDEKLAVFRSVDTMSPTRCRAVWLPAL